MKDQTQKNCTYYPIDKVIAELAQQQPLVIHGQQRCRWHNGELGDNAKINIIKKHGYEYKILVYKSKQNENG